MLICINNGKIEEQINTIDWTITMASRRGSDGFSSPSVEETDEMPGVSRINPPRENNLGPHDELDHSTGSSDQSRETRREENPFSFKHFLKKDTRPNYNLAGARPKVYSPARISPQDDTNVTDNDEIYPCNPTELPDFVQDHLVIEQCYLNHDASAVPLVADIDNLPDFTLNSEEQRQLMRERRQSIRTANRNENCEPADTSCDLPFDLTGDLRKRRSSGHPFHIPDPKPIRRRGLRREIVPRQAEPSTLRNIQGLPFDLPPVTPESLHLSDPAGSTNSIANESSSVNKSLPDFLNDGPIRNRVGISPGESDPSLDMPERSDTSLLLENERLRDELEVARGHIADRTRMIESLKAELASRRAVDHDETAHLEKAIEQVEVNLIQSTKRATSAESAVVLLKQEVKALTAELTVLRSENRELRSIAGAGCADYRIPGTERKIKKLSDELRAAAVSAEVSLRQLMSGVSNLKVLASALENVDRIEERTKDFLPDFEEENAAGPAL